MLYIHRFDGFTMACEVGEIKFLPTFPLPDITHQAATVALFVHIQNEDRQVSQARFKGDSIGSFIRKRGVSRERFSGHEKAPRTNLHLRTHIQENPGPGSWRSASSERS